MTTDGPAVSVVVPVFRNAEGLMELVERLATTMQSRSWTHEVLLVDDASGDLSWNLIRELAARRPEVIGVRLERNAGSTETRAAGSRLARGEVVCTIDADLENRPEDLALLVEHVRNGVDLVSAVRTMTVERPATSRAGSRLARFFCAREWDFQPHDLGCGMKAWSATTGHRAEELSTRHGELRFLLALHDVAQTYGEVATTWVNRQQITTHVPHIRLRLGVQLFTALHPRITLAASAAAAAATWMSVLVARRHPRGRSRTAVALSTALGSATVSAVAGYGVVLDRRTVRGIVAEVSQA